jgi:hypothetical protein
MSELGLFCMVALGAPGELEAARLLGALGDAAPRSAISVETCETTPGESAFAVEIDRQHFAVVAMPGKLPLEVDAAARQAGLLWPGRHAALDAHRGFIAISAAERASGHGLVRAQAVALTRLAAALAKLTPALAICWPTAASAIAPERLALAVAAIPAGIWPVDLWIGYTLIGADRGGAQLIGARTRGAVAYFGAEIEIAPMPVTDKVEPLRIILNLTGHMMAHGAHVRDRQPIQVLGERCLFVQRVPGGAGRPGLIRLVGELSEVG